MSNNMFAEAQQSQAAQQAKVMNKSTGVQPTPEKQELTAFTLSITKAEKEKLQMFALKNHMKTAHLIRKWIAENIPDDF